MINSKEAISGQVSETLPLALVRLNEMTIKLQAFSFLIQTKKFPKGPKWPRQFVIPPTQYCTVTPFANRQLMPDGSRRLTGAQHKERDIQRDMCTQIPSTHGISVQATR